MSSHDMNEVLLSPEDVVMLQEVGRPGESVEDTLRRVLRECRKKYQVTVKAVGTGEVGQ